MNENVYNQVAACVPLDDDERMDREIILKYISENEDVLTRDNEIAHMTASAWIVNKDRTKVVMIYHNLYDSWAWVGGHADGDEDLSFVVRKEIEEETGLTNVKSLKDGAVGVNIITVDQHMKRGKYVNSHLHFDVEFLFEADEADALRIKEDENSGVKWVDINEVEDITNEPKMKKIYRRLNEKLRLL